MNAKTEIRRLQNGSRTFDVQTRGCKDETETFVGRREKKKEDGLGRPPRGARRHVRTNLETPKSGRDEIRTRRLTAARRNAF